MGTPLQDIYESFFIKANEDFTYKEDQVFKYFTTAIGKSYKTVPSKLDFNLNKNEVILTVFENLEVPNTIFLNLNEHSYEIPISSEDNIEIANIIKTQIENDFNVNIKLAKYPRLVISSKDGGEISYGVSVLDDFNLDIEVSNSYNGQMNSTLGYDEIELIAMFMQLENYIKIKSELEQLKMHIGTKDFNKLPNKKVEYDNINTSIKDLESRIFKFRQEFYSYRNGVR